jgi:hypothetical protein
MFFMWPFSAYFSVCEYLVHYSGINIAGFGVCINHNGIPVTVRYPRCHTASATTAQILLAKRLLTRNPETLSESEACICDGRGDAHDKVQSTIERRHSERQLKAFLCTATNRAECELRRHTLNLEK